MFENLPAVSGGDSGGAQTQQSKGKSWSLLHTLFRPLWRFFRAYVLRRGFLDGFPGFWIALATAFFAFDRYARVYEAEHTKPTA